MAETGSTDPIREMSQDGADITGAASLAGGWGIRGWLSSIWTKFLSLGFISHEDETAVCVSIAHVEQFHVHLDAENLTASQAFMLIDLSDTTTWPHTNTHHIVVQKIALNINPATAFRGDIEIGFLSDVDGTNGDFNIISSVHLDQSAQETVVNWDFIGGADMTLDAWFGPTSVDDTLFQTAVNLDGPDGATDFPSGPGDLVMKVTRTAGAADVSITVLYKTKSG